MAKRRARKKLSVWRMVWFILKWLWYVPKILAIWVFKLAMLLAEGLVFLINQLQRASGNFRQQPQIAGKDQAAGRLIAQKAAPSFKDFDVNTTVAGDYERFSESLLVKSQIILVFGKRGSGKSALGFRILENIHSKTNRKCFALGVDQSRLPRWIKQAENLDDTATGGVVLVDEGAVTFASRESMRSSHIELGKMLAVARHKDISVIFITQNTGMIDKNVLNLADAVLIKETSLLQKQMERPAVRSLIEKADAAIKLLPAGERVSRAYVLSDDFEGLTNISLPSFWTERLSKSRSA